MPSREISPTLATVAASAGVSVATVSKVVNGRADVGPETRARVENLLQEHRYVGRRTEPARSPSTRGPSASVRTVEVIFHGPGLSIYCLEILEGVLQAGTEAGVRVAVSVRPRLRRGRDVRQPEEWVRELTERAPSAVIDVVDDVRQGDLAALTKARMPLVVIDPLSLPRRQVTSIGTTNFSGGLAATEHLLSLGHRRIAFLGGPAEAAYNLARMHGYRAAMETAGVPVTAEYVRTAGYDYEAGVAGGAALLDLPHPPTAVFAATDESAAGVLEAARVRGLQVPRDLSLVGFDDTAVARLLSPPLTTVRQPLLEMGRVALRTVLRLAAGEQLDSHHVELATELIVRGSTAAPSLGRVRD